MEEALTRWIFLGLFFLIIVTVIAAFGFAVSALTGLHWAFSMLLVVIVAIVISYAAEKGQGKE